LKKDSHFEEIYYSEAHKVLNLCFRMLGDEQTARDLAQDIWIQVYQHLDSFEGRSAISTWIYRITINRIINYLKQKKRRFWQNLLEMDIFNLAKTEEETSYINNQVEKDPLEGLQKSELEKIVWNCILKLPAKQRIPLILFRYQGLSYKEIADILGVSLSSVESRLHRAKKKLQKLLEPYLDKI